ncbi:HAD family hydrolase [Pontibacillus halophilus JSM 076056 = DSM 19796]|uniref:HAD family hydrolase n=2 Tax=Pontibacillus TaxID=289201 RepID=A0A0A5GCC3_9BACI|nr:HAD family hydrolase [Pontibacillus halophilus JSM 076056 = DSM 19796]
MEQIQKIMDVLSLAENLKQEMRHSWLSNGRQESVAEHTWRMSLMAVLVQPYLDRKVNMEKLLKMVIIHDLIEAEAGDVPAFDAMNDTQIKREKEERELDAILSLKRRLPSELGVEIYELWMEFEGKETYTAKVANALDKLEVQLQHNEADIHTWLDIEKEMTFQMGKHVEFDSFLSKMKDQIEQDGEQKMLAAGVEYRK